MAAICLIKQASAIRNSDCNYFLTIYFIKRREPFDKVNYKKYSTGDDMRPIKIPEIPPTASKSVRFPVDVIDEVENAIRGKNCTFSAFVVEAVRIMLENLEEDEKP